MPLAVGRCTGDFTTGGTWTIESRHMCSEKSMRLAAIKSRVTDSLANLSKVQHNGCWIIWRFSVQPIDFEEYEVSRNVFRTDHRGDGRSTNCRPESGITVRKPNNNNHVLSDNDECHTPYWLESVSLPKVVHLINTTCGTMSDDLLYREEISFHEILNRHVFQSTRVDSYMNWGYRGGGLTCTGVSELEKVRKIWTMWLTSIDLTCTRIRHSSSYTEGFWQTMHAA